MEALRRSLDQVSSGKKKTAKADAGEAAKKVTNIKAAQERRQEAQGFVRSTMASERRWGATMARKAVWGSYKRRSARSLRARNASRPIPVAVGSLIQSGGTSHTNARITTTQMS